MRTTRVIWIACLSGFAISASASPPQRPEVAAAIDVLDAWIGATAAAREEPGLAIGIVHDQDLIWSKGYGHADRERRVPVTASTLFRIGSISKLFTTTAIMQLRDAGKLRLDDPVSSQLSWFQVKSAAPDAPGITIRHLLTHTSGLARELPLPYWNDLRFPTRAEMIRLAPMQQAILPPETKFKYSNLALAIAGEIVAAVSGEPYERYVAEHIWQPLRMRSTRVTPDSRTPGLATGYRKRVPGQPREVEDFIDAGGLTPAANIASSVEDLAKFAALQFRDGPAGGAQILRGSTLREMRRGEWAHAGRHGRAGEGVLCQGVRQAGRLVP